jgi:ABC-2 type transport system permease protein
VFRREYVERVRKRTFVILTFTGPFLIALMVIVPNLLLRSTSDRPKPLAVIDLSGRMAEPFARLLEGDEENRLSDGSPRYPVEVIAADRAGLPAAQEELNRRIARQEIHGYLVVGEDLGGGEVSFYSRNASNLQDQEVIRAALSDAVVPIRFRDVGVEMEMTEIRGLTRRVRIDPVQIGKHGQVEAAGQGAQFGKLIAAYGMVIVFYMTFLMWGLSIMRGVVEEKSSRVIEVILSSVNARQLMAGKVLGIGAVALTQYLAWAATGIVVSIVMTTRMGLGEWVSTLSLWTAAAFVGYFILGYLFYASYFAALGACCSTDQEAQQVQQVGMLPVVIGFFMAFYAFFNPETTMATALSFFPPFTPFVMMVRTTVLAPPLWEILVSIGAMVAGIALLTVLAAKVFRVGILMTGKKPTLFEIWRWVRYA